MLMKQLGGHIQGLSPIMLSFLGSCCCFLKGFVLMRQFWTGGWAAAGSGVTLQPCSCWVSILVATLPQMEHASEILTGKDPPVQMPLISQGVMGDEDVSCCTGQRITSS